jgi:hypothetical protein
MPFAYYDRLSARDQAVYRASDRVTALPLARPEELRPLVEPIRAALLADDRAALESAAAALARALTAMIGVSAPDVGVLAVRPSLSDAELHGLYTRDEHRRPRIRVWMRTVRHRRVVAFRTFLRTLLHEIGHHLDYEHLRLPDSFHTEGFFKRESSLFYQLVPREGPTGWPRGDR